MYPTTVGLLLNNTTTTTTTTTNNNNNNNNNNSNLEQTCSIPACHFVHQWHKFTLNAYNDVVHSSVFTGQLQLIKTHILRKIIFATISNKTLVLSPGGCLHA